MKLESNEQWKVGGDCRKCRRRNYCKKVCRANRDYERRTMQAIIRNRTGIDAIEQAMHNLTK